MTQDDVLFGYRLQLFDLAARTTVTHACRTFGVHRSTYYAWKRQVDRQGLEMLRPRERRRPVMPNQLSPVIEQRIVAFALGHPGLGPRRISAQLARPQWGGLLVSPNGVYKALVRHGLSTRAKRLALIAGYRAPYEPSREPEPEPHIDTTRPGELVGIDCFYVGRLHGTAGTVWQITAIDTYSSFAWAELVAAPNQGPGAEHTSRLARRVARDLRAAGWQLERMLSDNGNEFRSRVFGHTIAELGARHSRIRAGRPQSNGHVERLHRTILEECWRTAFARFLQVRFTGLRRELATYLDYYNHHRSHTGRITAGRCPAELVSCLYAEAHPGNSIDLRSEIALQPPAPVVAAARLEEAIGQLANFVRARELRYGWTSRLPLTVIAQGWATAWLGGRRTRVALDG